MTRHVLLVVSLTVAAMAGSCATPDPASADGVSVVQFTDVVVPDGLQLRDVAHESHSKSEAAWRMGHFVYTGQTGVQAAASYVRERMPQHNWTQMSDKVLEDGAVQMRFERDVYSAEYVFRRAEGATQMVVDYDTQFQRR